jgi:phosphatidylserine/phosphatidylglycerophosphate/cardiolipin synthase-like enzyme
MDMGNVIDDRVDIPQLQVFTSLDGHFAISDILSHSMTRAIDRVLISAPWFGKSFVNLMRNNLRQGIEIRILTSTPAENFHSTFDAINSLKEIAHEHQWSISSRCVSKIHSKFMIIDDQICVQGSLNPTESGMYYNKEVGIVINSKILVEGFVNFFFEIERMSIKWDTAVNFHGLSAVDKKSVLSSLAEKYIGIFFSNGNTPLLKWKICKLLKEEGFEDKDIMDVERNLVKHGTLYEPKLDMLCLASTL